jgi:predicted amidohydrolase YtcJ
MQGRIELADKLLVNAKVHTMDAAWPWATEVAIAGNRILALGDDVRQLAAPDCEVVDLADHCVLPGLTDSHIHFTGYALSARSLDLKHAGSLAEVLALVAQRVRMMGMQDEDGVEWIEGTGWDQEHWPEDRFPTAADLDLVAPSHPVVLRAKSGHALVANSVALHRAGITAQTPDPPGGRIGRSGPSVPDGMLFEESAMRLVEEHIPLPPVDRVDRAIREAITRAWQLGLTAIHDMDGELAFAAYQRLQLLGLLGLRVIKYLPADMIDDALDLSRRASEEENWLRIGGIKVFADGALGARTAAMLAPYEGEPDNVGILTIEYEELRELAEKAISGRLPLAVHAIGDRANRMVLDILTAVGARGRSRRPHRIEHVQLLHPDDLDRLARCGLVASMQPSHAVQDRAMAERYWGARCATAYAWRSLLDAGTVLAFGSDAPVEDPNPFLGIHAAVTRQSPDQGADHDGWYPGQRISVQEAVYAYTLGAAYAGGTEDLLGSLAPGKLADLVVLDRDIFRCDLSEIAGTRVLATMINGRFVHRDV